MRSRTRPFYSDVYDDLRLRYASSLDLGRSLEWRNKGRCLRR
ncbi:hypothetical protein [Nostoc sp. NMS8]|nr:hypothetical protein [Nostoc sp. NMS8]